VASFRLLYTAPPPPPPPPRPVAPVLALPAWAVGALIGGGSVLLFAAFVGLYAMLGGRVAPSLSPLPKPRWGVPPPLRSMEGAQGTACSDERDANRIVRFGTGRQKMVLERGTNPKLRGVRVALGTGYNRVEGNRRASRNGLVSDLPPEIP
jgi:hypothetical protein